LKDVLLVAVDTKVTAKVDTVVETAAAVTKVEAKAEAVKVDTVVEIAAVDTKVEAAKAADTKVEAAEMVDVAQVVTLKRVMAKAITLASQEYLKEAEKDLIKN